MKAFLITLIAVFSFNSFALTESEVRLCVSSGPSFELKQKIENAEELMKKFESIATEFEQEQFFKKLKKITMEAIDCNSMDQGSLDHIISFAKSVVRNQEEVLSIEKIGNYGVFEHRGVLLKVDVNLGESCFKKRDINMPLEAMIYNNSNRYMQLYGNDKSSSDEENRFEHAENIDGCHVELIISKTADDSRVKSLVGLVEDIISKK